MKQASGAACVCGYAGVVAGWGCPLLMRMSHRPRGDWASDITVVLSEEESNSPQMSFTADG